MSFDGQIDQIGFTAKFFYIEVIFMVSAKSANHEKSERFVFLQLHEKISESSGFVFGREIVKTTRYMLSSVIM